MNLLNIKIKNVLGIEELNFSPKTNIVEISGKNASGKSSTLSAIKSALGVSEHSNLLRNGSKKGEVVIDLGDLKIEKTYSEKQPKGALSIKGKVAGTDSFSKLTGPASILKGLINENSVNPTQLLTCSDKELVGAVLEAIPMQVDSSKMSDITGKSGWNTDVHALVTLGQATKSIMEQRRDVNRDLKTTETTLSQLEVHIPEEAPDVDSIYEQISEHTESLNGIRDSANTAGIAAHEKGKKVVDKITGELEELQAELGSVQQAFYAKRSEQQAAVDAQAKAKEDAYNAELDKAQEFQDAITELNKELASYGKVQATIEQCDEYRRAKRGLSRKSRQFTTQLEGIEEYKQVLCSDLPIKGLELVDGKLIMDGIPFSTLNTAARVDLVIEIAKLSAGKLGLVICDDLESLDEENYNAFLGKAKETDLTFIFAKVSDNDLEIR